MINVDKNTEKGVKMVIYSVFRNALTDFGSLEYQQKLSMELET